MQPVVLLFLTELLKSPFIDDPVCVLSGDADGCGCPVMHVGSPPSLLCVPIRPLDADAPLCDGRDYIYAWMSSAVPSVSDPPDVSWC
jgi:hypothetical protein